jgi:phosphoribosylformylglycinamidine cyclo-ligase
MSGKGISYKRAGVDIAAADKLVKYISGKAEGIGGFGGLFSLPKKGYANPLLVASTDGVGTKLLIARKMGVLNSIGIDLVAMVVNDIITCGARPLFFLDYYAVGKLDLKEARQVLDGILKGCRMAGCKLLGGETAELPGLYGKKDFDLAGFGVGIVDKTKVIDGSGMRVGDVLIGLGSSGMHSNGYSLARKVLLGKNGMSLGARLKGLKLTLGRELLRPTIIYVPLVMSLIEGLKLKAIANITGGGIEGNLVRVLGKGVSATVRTESWEVPEIFRLVEKLGPVSGEEMLRTFNMGIGMILVVSRKDEEKVHEECKRHKVGSYTIGKIIAGEGKVTLE